MKTMQKAVLAICFATVLGSGVYEAREREVMKGRVEDAAAKEIQMRAEMERLALERDAARERLKALGSVGDEMEEEAGEIHRLRGAVTELGAATWRETRTSGTPADAQVRDLLEATKELKQLAVRFPEKAIPELETLTEDDWFELAKGVNPGLLQDQSAVRRIYKEVRRRAKLRFANELVRAVERYREANGGRRPGHVLDLNDYFAAGIPAGALERYEVVAPGMEAKNWKTKMRGRDAEVLLRERERVDEEHDTRLMILEGRAAVTEDWE